jgi:hypothetical protein
MSRLRGTNALRCSAAASGSRRVVVDAHGHWLAGWRILAATRQQRQQRRRAQEHDYDVSFH